MTIRSKEEMDQILKELDGVSYEVSEVKIGERVKKAPLPFTTSTLQQEASKTLNFSTQKTMSVAQQLYEGVDIKGSGTVALISYLRTDSTRSVRGGGKGSPRLYLFQLWRNVCVCRTQRENQRQKDSGCP